MTGDSPKRDVTIQMSQKMADEIEGHLEYGDSRAEWIRKACRERLAEGDSAHRDTESVETNGAES